MLPLLSFSGLVQSIQNALAAGTLKVTNFASGSIALAISNAVSSAIMSLQQLIVHVFNTNRLATSTGNDIVTFVGDWGLTPSPAAASFGFVTLTRGVTSSLLNVSPTGSIVQVPVLGVQFNLIPDPTGTLTAWNPSLGVYQFEPTVASITAAVRCAQTGPIGNIAANTLTQPVSGFQGVNSITNPNAFTNGVVAETGAQLQQAFIPYMSSFKTAGLGSIETAITGVQPGLTYQILEYFTFSLGAWPAGFTIIADDGTGAASTAFLTKVSNAVNAVRAAGAEFAVSAPSNVAINVSVDITAASGFSLVSVETAVLQALTQYINTLGVGAAFPFTGNGVIWTDIADIVQNVPGVFAYSNLLLNGSAANVAITITQLPQIGSVSF